MSRGLDTSGWSESTKKLNKPLLVQAGHLLPAVEVKTGRRTRQRADKRSELEIKFGEYLRNRWPNARIYEQFPIRIGNGCNYYVDYVVVCQHEQHRYVTVHAYEVKGPFSRANGITKLKAAASLCPWIKFQMASDGLHKWELEDILP